MYDFIFQRYGWDWWQYLECPGWLFDELQQVWLAEGESQTKKPQVAETHDELLANAREQGFATTAEEYDREMNSA